MSTLHAPFALATCNFPLTSGGQKSVFIRPSACTRKVALNVTAQCGRHAPHVLTRRHNERYGRRHVREERMQPRLGNVYQPRLSPVCRSVASDMPESDSDVLIQSKEEYASALEAAGDDLVVIAWVASWCRKCIYLKPKLRKCLDDMGVKHAMFVNVNALPGPIVRHAGVSNLPTIQVWRGGEKLDQRIGGAGALAVLEEVKEMVSEHL